jgi:hypothetical protein
MRAGSGTEINDKRGAAVRRPRLSPRQPHRKSRHGPIRVQASHQSECHDGRTVLDTTGDRNQRQPTDSASYDRGVTERFVHTMVGEFDFGPSIPALEGRARIIGRVRPERRSRRFLYRGSRGPED